MAASVTARSMIQRIDPIPVGQHADLGVPVRIADGKPGQEPVPLRFGQRVGALHLDGILGGQHQERPGQPIAGAVDGDLPLLHALQQGGLRLGRGPVDLVGDHDVGEDRARPEFELGPAGRKC